MNLDEMRKHYPFISYGDEYQLWEKNTEWYNWLLDRITTEEHASGVGHEWNTVSAWLFSLLRDRDKLFKALPKPTKEQISDQDDPDYPFKEGKCPEQELPAIREFAVVEAKTRKMSRRVAAVLVENEYCINVLKQKTYPSKRWGKGD